MTLLHTGFDWCTSYRRTSCDTIQIHSDSSDGSQDHDTLMHSLLSYALVSTYYGGHLCTLLSQAVHVPTFELAPGWNAELTNQNS